jgi:cation:H+ antiporter
MVVFMLIAPLTRTDGLVLLGLFAAFLGYVATREVRRSVPVFHDEEVFDAAAVGGAGGGGPAWRPAGTDGTAGGTAWAGAGAERRIVDDLPFARSRELPGWAHLGLAALALAGLVVGAATTSLGTEGILRTTASRARSRGPPSSPRC